MIEGLEKYIQIIHQFLSGEVDVGKYEHDYLELFKNEKKLWDENIYNILNSLFLDIDAYCQIPEIMDENSITEKELRKRSSIALEELKEFV